jgi:hypothetical protein
MAQVVPARFISCKLVEFLLLPACRGLESCLPPSNFENRAHPASGEEIMSSSERRIDTRVNIAVPVRFRALNNPGATDQTAESENISQRGIFFSTIVPLKIGTPVEVSLRMPQELAGRPSSEVKCVARVVHVRPSAAPGGMLGIGLHIERFETQVAARERWAS